jgi:raffinose/stachyose/melibiose transport system permease protein
MSIGARVSLGIVRYGFLTLAAVITVAPLLVIGSAALFRPGAPITGFAIPERFHWSTFAYAWIDGDFGRAFQTSAIIALVVVVVTGILAVSAGYALGTMRFRGGKISLYIFMSGIVTPYIALILPIYFEFQSVGLLGSYWGIVLAECGLYLGFGVFWMRAFFLSIPRSLVEAARLDGASSLQTLVRVLIPVARPAITTLMMLCFFASWNEYLVPLVLGGTGQAVTVSLALSSFQGQHLTDIPSLAAASLIVACPSLGVYVVMQRSFFRGLLEGAVK